MKCSGDDDHHYGHDDKDDHYDHHYDHDIVGDCDDHHYDNDYEVIDDDDNDHHHHHHHHDNNDDDDDGCERGNKREQMIFSLISPDAGCSTSTCCSPKLGR